MRSKPILFVQKIENLSEMPKHSRREDSESDEEVPLPKKNCFELPRILQNEVVVGLIVSNITPGRDLLQSIKIESLLIRNLYHLVLPHWLSEISSIKEIVIENCKSVNHESVEVEEDVPPYHFKLCALTSMTFKMCKKIYINSFSEWAPNLKTVKFDMCDCVDIVGESSACVFEEVYLNRSTFGNLDWIGSESTLKRVYMHYNRLSEIPIQICNISHLENVDLLLGSIPKIPKISTMWPNIRVLVLNCDSTTQIEDESFEELQKLESLTINWCSKAGSLQQIASIPNLKNLFLHNVYFDKIDISDENSFQKLETLRVWTFGHSFPTWIHRCKNLRSLWLHGSHEKQPKIPENLTSLVKLKDIHLSNISPNSSIVSLLMMPSLESISVNSYSWNK